MTRPSLAPEVGAAARFRDAERIGVLLVQQETNSFAMHPGTIERFTIWNGAEAADRLVGANSEFAGALDELDERGAVAIPLLYAHSLPGGVLTEASYSRLHELTIGSIRRAGRLDGLIVCLHGAMSAGDDACGDLRLLRAIRAEVGDVALALTLDLHANVTADLVAEAHVTTGYRTNPHVDLADTGRRAVMLLAATMNRTITPVTAAMTCPAIFPDESLRTPGGLLDEVLDEVTADIEPTVIDVSLFPSQPWLDARGVGFTAVVVADADLAEADRVAAAIARGVWRRRFEFVADGLMTPEAALDSASQSTVRPFVITESADAPTAGATGDGAAVLAALLTWPADRTAAATIVDAEAVATCHAVGTGTDVTLRVGASLDDRWSPPTWMDVEVIALGDGDHQLIGEGYTGLWATMGRFAVVRRDGLRLLITELPAWSADPGSWRHAGIDPFDVDLLVVKSCTDYMANFPQSAPTAVVADVPGPATPRLSRLAFERADVVPFPIDPGARFDGDD